MKLFFLISLIPAFAILQLQGQNPKDKVTHPFLFSRLTFHTTACFGSCPAISLNLYSDRQIEVSRTIYKPNFKGKVDSALTGNYKGHLNEKDFKKVISLLKKINWDTLTFPKIFCCDAPIRTIIILYNGKLEKFKSMQPPKETNDLFSFLSGLASKTSLIKYNKIFHFDNF